MLRTSGITSSACGGATGTYAQRPGKIRNCALDADDRGVVGVVQLVAAEIENRDALDEIHTLSPVIERGQRPDDAHRCVGELTIVVRHVGQTLDLPNDVVAEVPHHTALQWRQVGDDRRAIDAQQFVERSKHAAIERNRRRHVTERRDHTVAQFERGYRVAPDEAVTAPAFAVLD